MSEKLYVPDDDEKRPRHVVVTTQNVSKITLQL
jgi:hypothetical protein